MHINPIVTALDWGGGLFVYYLIKMYIFYEISIVSIMYPLKEMPPSPPPKKILTRRTAVLIQGRYMFERGLSQRKI